MRLNWITAAMVLAGSYAVVTIAHAAPSVEQQLTQCASIQDKLDRLICFDQLAQDVATNKATVVTTPTQASTAPVATSTPAVAAPVVAAPVATSAPKAEAIEEFGLKKKAEEDKVDKLYFEVASTDKDPYGALIVTLTNGQVWKQTELERYKVKKGQRIYIEAGALGSFLLGTDDRNSTTRVKRLR